jgi:hypothetical protein
MSPRLTAPLLLLLLLVLHGALTLKLCSFNVRSFGESKKENRNAMDVIVKVSTLLLSVGSRTPLWLSSSVFRFYGTLETLG